jgi:succinylglutamic semialdehyde dehydrogenase
MVKVTNFVSTNPATGEVLWKGTNASPNDIDTAILSANKAIKTWSKKSLEERISILLKFRDLMKEKKNLFAEMISKENGKPLWESKAEVDSMTTKVDFSIEAYQDRCKQLIRQQPAGLSVTRHKPHGVVAIFGPFNFPGHLPNGHIVPALLAGNTIVFKPSELTPWVGEEMVKIWEKAGLPEGVLNIVQGGVKTGKYLVNHPGIHGVFFTGSWKTGKIISEQMVEQPQKILALELGGNNPLIIGKITNKQAAAYIAAQSAFITSGQRCTCARRLIIPKGTEGDIFLENLSEIITKIQIGKYEQNPEPFMGPLITEDAAKKIMEVQEMLIKKGGIPIIKSERKEAFVTPGLIDVSSVKDRPDEEFFGPLLQVIRVKDLDAAIEEANNTSFGLTAGILSDSKEEYEKVLEEVRAGLITWNSSTTGAYGSAPFGGTGQSGNYRPSGYYAVDYCSYPVASVENNELSLPKTFPPGIKLQ